MKKKFFSLSTIALVFALVFVMCNLFLALANENKEKVVLSDSLSCTTLERSLDNFINLSDNIIIGSIIDFHEVEREVVTGTPWDEKIRSLGALPKETYTMYRICVEKSILGSDIKPGDIIEYQVFGGLNTCVTKPKEIGRVVTFMNKHTSGYYVDVGFEEGMYEIDSNNKLYSFSNIDSFESFDGNDISSLENYINEKAVIK